MRPGIKGAMECVYIVMKGSLADERRLPRNRVGRIHTLWTSLKDAEDEIEWQIDREISQSGQQTSGYWIDYRGVLTTREEDRIAN